MDKRGANEGFRVLDDFVCEAIPDPVVPLAPPNRRGQNEGVRVLEELSLDIAQIPQETELPSRTQMKAVPIDPRCPVKSIADQLPPEIARQIHPDWRKNEAEYWAVRDQLLSQYQGQWIGFADGVVIASGTSPVAVFHAAEASGRHSFVTCVGREDEPCRIRRPR